MREIFKQAERGAAISRRAMLYLLGFGTLTLGCGCLPLFLRQADWFSTELEPGYEDDGFYWHLIPDQAQPPQTIVFQPGWLKYDEASNQMVVKDSLLDTVRFINHLTASQFIPGFSPDNPAALADQAKVGQQIQTNTLADNLDWLSRLDQQTESVGQLLDSPDIGSQSWHDSFQDMIRLLDAKSVFSRTLASQSGLDFLPWTNFYQSLGFNQVLTSLPEAAFNNQTTVSLLQEARQRLNDNFSASVGELVNRPDLLNQRLQASLNFEIELVRKSFLGMLAPDYLVGLEIARQQLINRAGQEQLQQNLAVLLGEDVRDPETGDWVKPGLKDKIITWFTYNQKISRAKTHAGQEIDFLDISEQIGAFKQQLLEAVLISGYQRAGLADPSVPVPPAEQILNLVVGQLQVNSRYAFGDRAVEITPELTKQIVGQQMANLHSTEIIGHFFWKNRAPIVSFKEIADKYVNIIARYFETARDGLPPVDSSVFLTNLVKQDEALSDQIVDPDQFVRSAEVFFRSRYDISLQEFLTHYQAECLAKASLGLALENTFLNARPGEINFKVGRQEVSGELPTMPSAHLDKRGVPFYYPDDNGEQRYLPFFSFGFDQEQVAQSDFHLVCVSDKQGQLKLTAVKQVNWNRFRAENLGQYQRPTRISFRRARFGRLQGLGLDKDGDLSGKWPISTTIDIDYPDNADLIWVGNFQVAKPDYEWEVVSGAIFKLADGSYQLRTEDKQIIASPDLNFAIKEDKGLIFKKEVETKYLPFDLVHGGIFSIASLTPLQKKLHTILKSYDPQADLPLAFIHGLEADLNDHSDQACSYWLEPLNQDRSNPLGWQNVDRPSNRANMYYVLFDPIRSISPDDDLSEAQVVFPLGETSDYLPVLTDSRTFKPRILTQRKRKFGNDNRAVDTGERRQFISAVDAVAPGQERFVLNPALGQNLTGVKGWLFEQFQRVSDYTAEKIGNTASHYYWSIAFDRLKVVLIKSDFDAVKRAKQWRSLGLIAAQLGLNYLTHSIFASWTKMGLPWQFFQAAWLEQLLKDMNKVEPIQ